VTDPSRVVNQPNGNPPCSAVGVYGPEVNSIRATNMRWSRIGRRGVMTSSSPSRVQFACDPSTRTLSTESPAKSRLKRESDCVARASIVTLPSTVCSGVLVGYIMARW
jgi:hypothetical protein